MPEPFDFLQQRLRGLTSDHALRRLRPVINNAGATLVYGGHRLINFGSNDYLGLAGQCLPESFLEMARGAGASPLVCGYTSGHERLCELIAALEQTEAAVLFPSGYGACCGVAATLPQARDLILSDQLNHASLIDGCRLSAATRMIYPHRNVAAVGELLAQYRSDYQQVWIITDTVFGMDGTLAPLAALCELAERYEAFLIVDEAHATGVLGPDGSGASAHLGVKSRVPIRIGTLSKAIGSQGGFVAGPRVVIDYLINACRPLIFSTAASPLVIAAATAGLETIKDQPQRRERVRSHARQVREALGLLHEDDQGNEIPIIAILVGENERALLTGARAEAAGFFIPAIRPPTVPEGTARLRVSLSAAHDQRQLAALIDHLQPLIKTDPSIRWVE